MTDVDPRWSRVQEFARTAGNNPRLFAYVVTELVDDDVWREFERPPHRLERYVDFDKFCQDYAEISAEQVLEICEVVDIERTNPHRRGFDKLRRLVHKTTAEQPIGRKGGTDNIRTGSAGTDPSYLLRRLQRDDPKLANKVIAGDLTPHAAAVQAGIRRPYVQVRTDDVSLAVAVLLRHYDKNEILEALT